MLTSLKTKWNTVPPRTRGMTCLISAVLLEMGADLLLKYSEGCTVPWATAGCAVLFFFCFFLYAKVLVTVELGISYAIWSGVGIIFLAAASVFIFHQALNTMDIIGLALIIIGIMVISAPDKSK